MKISRIAVKNFQGLQAFDLPVRAPLLMFSGPNGAGKSSLRDAIAMGLSGAPTRVSKKKDFGQLVHEAHQSASIEIDLADGRRSVTALPGDGTKFAGKQIEDENKARAALQYVLAPQQFAAAGADERRGVLFTLTGCVAGADEVAKRLAARGADSTKAEAVLPLLRVGFPAAEEDARNRAKEAKGAWRGVTGETYGDKKAETWRADKPVVDEQQLLQAEQGLDVVDGEIAQAQRKLGELQAQHQAGAGRVAQITKLQELASKVPSIERKLAADELDLANVRDEVVAITTGPAPRVGLVHDLARALNLSLTMAIPFGDMTAEQRGHLKSAGATLEQYAAEHGSLADDGVPPSAADLARLPQLQHSLAMMDRAVANDHRDLQAAKDAATQLQALQNTEGAETVTDTQLQAATQQIDELKARRKQLAADLDAMRASQRAAAEAYKKTAAARQHHADVQAWTLIADAMAPDGIPGELLNDALRPVNDLLFELAKLAGWARVQLSRDMDITADGRLYGLLSESEQWRADTLLALTLAKLSGLKLVVLDRFDVLDLTGRGDLLDLLYALAEDGTIDTAVVCGTLKKAPDSDGLMESYWVQNGEVSAVAPQQERAAA
ncbi:AAA family ATPase [Chromobacterium violaceum]|uniref:AAA family ATPase n=1 Tax=Chromobacterium violaceum TaxID=536 RepID=UPI00385C2FDA